MAVRGPNGVRTTPGGDGDWRGSGRAGELGPQGAADIVRGQLVIGTVEAEVDGEVRTVVFRQIVGVAARRVVTRVAVGDELAAGQRIGLMRFGSRMDVFVPPHVAIDVAVGDRTRAGESVLARWPSRQDGEATS